MTVPRTLRPALAFLLVAALAAAWLVSPPSAAADPPTLTVRAPAHGWTGNTATVKGTTTVTDVPVVLEHRDGDRWKDVASAVPSNGTFALKVRLPLGALRLRVVQRTRDGDAEQTFTITGRRAPVQVRLSGARRLVDGRRGTLTARWVTTDGRKLNGTAVLWCQPQGGDWKRRSKIRVRDGRARIRVRPRVDTRYQLRTPRTAKVTAQRSASHKVDNVPPGRVFRKPSGAPAPRISLPPQPRVKKRGASVKVSKISRKVWRSMKGRTWHRGCPVGRSSLRLIRTNYYAYDGYRRRGEIVVNRSIAKATRKVFRDLHRAKVPIRSLYRVDRFGWSRRLRGGNDMKSMAAGNSSAFNCRGVVGRPGTRSPHSTGRSIDLNTWENPYRSHWGIVPNSTWDRRRTPKAFVYRTSQHVVVRIMARHGFWWMGSSDWQHFQYGGGRHRHTGSGSFLD